MKKNKKNKSKYFWLSIYMIIILKLNDDFDLLKLKVSDVRTLKEMKRMRMRKVNVNETKVRNLYNKLKKIIGTYHPSDNMTMIDKAFNIANNAHKGQCRKSGEPFIIHPLAVAIILANLKLDKETIAAALLHDVVEDTEVTNADIEAVFGHEVMFLVDGVTKLAKLSTEATKEEIKLESFRKLILATAEDIRVIIIKLADRLHNMQTLEFQTHSKQLEIANETMDIYSPIAQRLGISVLKIELEDLAFKYLFPNEYREIKTKISETSKERNKHIGKIVKRIKVNLGDAEIDAEVNSEMKHLFSIYRKMINKMKTIDEIYDIFAIKIIVDNVKDCYVVMGLLHSIYKPIPGRFKDYIAIPKENMYQSLHTTLISDDGTLFEVQIRTKEMDDIANYGILANWKYGEKGVDAKEVLKSQKEKSYWLNQILEWQKDITDNHEFINLVKSDFNIFTEIISCFTPKGDVKQLPKGSTVIDFAYAIHSDIGNKACKALVNGKERNIDYILKSGDRVDIIIDKNSKGPSLEWLRFVKTSNAKNKIKKWYKEINKEKTETVLTDNIKYKLAKCCLPIFDDDIVGVITQKRGVIVHRANCENVINGLRVDDLKIVNMTWNALILRERYSAKVLVIIENDNDNVLKVLEYMAKNHVEIRSLNVECKQLLLEMRMSLMIVDKITLQNLLVKLCGLQYVLKAERI